MELAIKTSGHTYPESENDENCNFKKHSNSDKASFHCGKQRVV